MFLRALHLPKSPSNSFFLWGPRQTGKSTLLRSLYPQGFFLNLLETNTLIRYLEAPWTLRKELEGMTRKPPLVVIDEVQRVPALLDEVHLLIEEKGMVFALCGSSARKVKRGGANLLGGRAVRYDLFGLTLHEVGNAVTLTDLLNRGSLPPHVTAEDVRPLLDAYVNMYLREEILAEGIVRSLPTFARALSAFALSDSAPVSYTTIARECGVSSQTVRDYAQILEDTLIMSLVPAFVKRPKRRVRRTPKVYFFDVGIVNVLAKRGRLEAGSEGYGKALENWIHHELRAHRSYSELHYDLSYWQLAGGTEVDFILGDMDAAVEVKATSRPTGAHLRGLRTLTEDHAVKRRILVCLLERAQRTDDGIDLLPVAEFCERLWSGRLIS